VIKAVHDRDITSAEEAPSGARQFHKISILPTHFFQKSIFLCCTVRICHVHYYTKEWK